ncbi:hexosaminidase D [Clarias gariepinus]|uniref:beta-N-acetylhexosaminidase n=1 Tax=Clarias gariepinus TaxID=13013 RepID=UPI00234C2E73|nr:beta-N-acetylhexosaminidase [Clarias gariepinus]
MGNIAMRILKIVFVCLGVLAAAKIVFHSGRKENGQHTSDVKYFLTPGRFWLPESVSGLSKLLGQPTEKNKTKSKDNVKSTLKPPVKMHAGPLRIVHLDLKGAPPKVSYFQQIFPLISSLGADGVLMEYEDMFPYEGELGILSSPFSYSHEEIDEIKILASLYNLELIPLVQVFGHLEFVLKHEKYFHLREESNYPNSLNPVVPESLSLVKAMLTQVLEKHPEARWFHIGADEVYNLGESEDSKNWLKENNKSVGALFLSHVTKVCHFLAEQKPGIKPIFWEDMLRKLDANLIKESGMQNLASPMIWKYDSNMDLSFMGEVLSNYQKAGFQNVWFASAFKGASGIDQRWTPINHHLQNHLVWLRFIDTLSKYPSVNVDGIALTGWQRYEHFTVLCELLPVAIPSLAVCLEALKYGSFNETAKTEAENILGCKIDIEANSCKDTGTFAGSEIYYMVQRIHNELQKSTEKIIDDRLLRGSFSRYQRKYNFANPRHVKSLKGTIIKVAEEWNGFMEKFRREMSTIFFPDTVEEWMEENVNQHLDKLHSLAKDLERIDKFKGQPKNLNFVQ